MCQVVVSRGGQPPIAGAMAPPVGHLPLERVALGIGGGSKGRRTRFVDCSHGIMLLRDYLVLLYLVYLLVKLYFLLVCTPPTQ